MDQTLLSTSDLDVLGTKNKHMKTHGLLEKPTR